MSKKIRTIKIFFWTAVVVFLFSMSAYFAFAKDSQPTMIGPRQNIASSTPSAYGFWSFSVLDNKKISRSGQPTLAEFKWLKQSGWKSIVDLRVDGEYKEIGDDRKIKGFKQLGFNYLSLPIRDGGVPTAKQAKQFLQFATEVKNQPVHIHCRGGYGRTGTLVALYRYEIDGWTMAQAIDESHLYHGGIDNKQKVWLIDWAKNHHKPHK